MKKMTDAEIAAALPKLAGWALKNGKLHREYKFSDFKRAMEFMQSAVAGIEKMNHHPEWFNVYNKVTVDLNTHDAGGITARDFELAELLEGLSKRAL
ncbi:MAG TPA: 4a-hydroxytetrahydrobiopterin dehydratase [Bryobacteraceae bacterium]|jgi:4a-hydroxytetrahydrobiopterin dehydratase|nr:4a-hydroxytetrahydrobiopterin dehydratase [Bryobacteraceae bacterium]